jgi:hypothetical protein
LGGHVIASLTVRPWFYDSEEHYYFEVRISGKPIELNKDKPAIDVGDKAKLPETIKVIIDAVDKGELDAFLLAPPPKFPSKKAKANGESKPVEKATNKVNTK